VLIADLLVCLLSLVRFNRPDRIVGGALERLTPFYAFLMDLEVSRVLSRGFEKEANQPLHKKPYLIGALIPKILNLRICMYVLYIHMYSRTSIIA